MPGFMFKTQMVRMVAFLLTGLLVGCGGQDRSRESQRPRPPVVERDTSVVPRPDPAEDTPETAAWTIGIVDLPASGGEMPVLEAVRNARHDNYDRVVFQFGPGGLPGVHAEYVDHPVRQCGSGEVVQIAGDAWILIRFIPAAAHTEEGQPTVGERMRVVNQPVLKQLSLICDFEADVSWVLGVGSPNQFRVFPLSSSPRVVVDIRH
ncbi:MAG: hypothetical protein SGI90_12985 [Candidatus Eisenbacteria bacterium]|nr:hypothetical protein [Candidatus Eisenbacteria bacterium]